MKDFLGESSSDIQIADTPVQIYHLADSAGDVDLIQTHLDESLLVCDLTWFETSSQLFLALEEAPCDLILLDYRLRRESSRNVLERLQCMQAPPPAIVLSDEVGEDDAVECLKSGAIDYVFKDRLGRLTPAIWRAMDEGREIVRRRRLESLLRQRERLESLGLLAGGLAHDFNNQLGAILALTEAAGATLPPEHAAQEHLRRAQLAGARAASLTRRLLAYSRNQTLEPKKVDLNDMVTETLQLLERLLPATIEVQTDLRKPLATVTVDPGQLQHVILNLCLNARDSMPEGGTMCLRTRRRTIESGDPSLSSGPYARLDVVDTGMGIPADKLESVFAPFFTTKGEAGTGLGLASALGTVTQSGGDIRVHSVHGQGSVFSVFLPESPEGAEPQPSDTYERARLVPTRPTRLLLVEDEELVRELAHDYFRDLGYDVAVASDGAEALTLLAEWQGELHALVTDIVMPQVGGREVARIALASHPRCRVVYTSGYSRESIFDGRLLGEGESFLQKPVPLAALARLLSKVLA